MSKKMPHPIYTQKYKITDNEKVIRGRKLYQIVATKDFGDVKAGELGGWIESEKNLSQEGNCWVAENARVYGEAVVKQDAIVDGDAKVFGNAIICGSAIVRGKAQVQDVAVVCNAAYLSMPKLYTGGVFFESSDTEPRYTMIEQDNDADFDKSRDRRYTMAINPKYIPLDGTILKMQEIIDEQAWEIEELKKKIPPESKK